MALVVLRRTDSEIDLPSFAEEMARQEVTTLGVWRVRSEGVDLAADVNPPHEPVTVPAGRIAADSDDVPESWSPFALNTEEASVKVEQHVATTPFTGWDVHVNPEFDRLEPNGVLGDVAFLISRQHATDATGRIGWSVS